jgi:hypothetical protein
MKGSREINYLNCFAASRPDRITAGILWIGRSNDKNGVYPTTELLKFVGRVYIKYEVTPEINYENCISASRHDRIIPVNLWIGRSNDMNGV